MNVERDRCRTTDPLVKDVGSSGGDDATKEEIVDEGKRGGGNTTGNFGTSSPISVADFSSAEGSKRGRKSEKPSAARDGDNLNKGNRTKGKPLKRRKASSRGGGSGAEEGGNWGTSVHALFRGNVPSFGKHRMILGSFGCSRVCGLMHGTSLRLVVPWLECMLASGSYMVF